MKCKVCGAINEDYLEYCENCAAPLKESQAAAGEPASGAPANSEAGILLLLPIGPSLSSAPTR